MFITDKKVIAIAVVVVIIIAAAAAFIVANDNDDDEDDQQVVSVIARVNTDGSGIYLKSTYNPSDFYTKSASGAITLTASAWGGKVFGTPGTSSIQHVQLQQLVTDMGLNFVKYDNQNKSSNTVYYVDTVTNADAALTKMNNILDGGILWQPQYAKIVDSDIYQEFLLTNDLFPGHTCCIIAGLDSYMDSNEAATEAFLAAYVQAVDYINKALADKTSAEYTNLVSICTKYTAGLTNDQIDSALSTITYTYADNSTGSLDNLEADIASLEENLTKLGSIRNSLSDLGFSSAREFADKLVDDDYLQDAIKGASKVDARITIAAITGDIHQIALRVANDLGYFSDYGLTVTVKQLDNGGAVATDLLSGNSDFGFLGAPPLTSNVVNGKYVTN